MPSTSGEDLLKKYDVPVPRYTSYPALPHWKGISDEDWIGAVERVSEGLVELPLSLYVHIPYCQSLCSFCGCTKVISTSASLLALRQYLKANSKDKEISGIKLHIATTPKSSEPLSGPAPLCLKPYLSSHTPLPFTSTIGCLPI